MNKVFQVLSISVIACFCVFLVAVLKLSGLSVLLSCLIALLVGIVGIVLSAIHFSRGEKQLDNNNRYKNFQLANDMESLFHLSDSESQSVLDELNGRNDNHDNYE